MFYQVVRPILVLGNALSEPGQICGPNIRLRMRHHRLCRGRRNAKRVPNTNTPTGSMESDDADSSKYVLLASMDVEPEKEALFNEVFAGHVPYHWRCLGYGGPGQRRAFEMNIGGEREAFLRPCAYRDLRNR